MNPKTDKYMDFESLYGTAEGMVEILPVIPKKGGTPPNGIKLHQSKVRGTVRCISCGKPRSFFSASRIKDRKLFTKGLEEIEFECGQPLFEVGSKPYQKEFAEVVVVNQNLDCESPIEVVYYSKNSDRFDATCVLLISQLIQKDWKSMKRKN